MQIVLLEGQVVNQKIHEFVTHLLSNPNIKSEPPLIAEGVVLNFIVKNLQQLKTTFKAPQFFPELSAKEVLNLIIEDLRQRTIDETMPELEKQIGNINFSIASKCFKKQPFAQEFYVEKFVSFVHDIFSNKDVRYNFNATYNILSNDILEKYLIECFNRRSPLFFELTRVGKNNFSVEEYISYLKILLIIKNAAYVKNPIEGFTESNVNISDFLKVPKTLAQYFNAKAGDLYKDLPGIPKDFVAMALKSNVGMNHVETEDTPAKFLYIFAHRFQNFKEYTKIERGAETPDKSWFGIAKKNAGYYNYDKRILEDLYIVAGDNNW